MAEDPIPKKFNNVYWHDGKIATLTGGDTDIVTILENGSETYTQSSRDYPAHITCVEVEEISATYTPGGESIPESFTVSYKNPHIKEDTLFLWNEVSGSYDIPVGSTPVEPSTNPDQPPIDRLADRLSNIRDYFDVYNPSEPLGRLKLIQPENIEKPLEALSQVHFRIEKIIAGDPNAAITDRFYLKFDVTASDYSEDYPFQGYLVAAIVGSEIEENTTIRAGETSFIVTDEEMRAGTKRDIHGFVTPDLGQKYSSFTQIENASSETRTYGIWIPWTGLSWDLIITPGWWDFQGTVTFSNFRVTKSKIYEPFQPSERMADQGLIDAVTNVPKVDGWMSVDTATDRFKLLSDDSNAGEVASANGMLLQGYTIDTNNTAMEIIANKQRYAFNASNNGVEIGLQRTSSTSPNVYQNVGTLMVTNASVSQGVYVINMLGGYEGETQSLLATGCRLICNGHAIALVRINGDGTIMVQSLLQISGDENSDDECVDDTSVGLKIEYVPPTSGTFPVEYYIAGCGTMVALAETAGVSIQSIHHRSWDNAIEPLIERTQPLESGEHNLYILKTFSGARSMVCPPVWYAKDSVATNPYCVEKDHFVVWPFYRQSVWINVTPPKDPAQPLPKLDDVKFFQWGTFERWGLPKNELYATPDVLAGAYSSNERDFIWNNNSDIIFSLSDFGSWLSTNENYIPRTPNSYVTADHLNEFPYPEQQTVTFWDYMNACKEPQKKVILYVSPCFHLPGMCHANNTRSALFHFFKYDTGTNATLEEAYSGEYDHVRAGILPDYFTRQDLNTLTREQADALKVTPQQMNQYKTLNGALALSDGRNPDSYLAQLEALFDLLLDKDSTGAYLRMAGLYMDGLYLINQPSSYYVIRKIRQLYYEKLASISQQPQDAFIVYHASNGPFMNMLLQPPLTEAYADMVYKEEAFLNMDFLRRGVFPGSTMSALPISLDMLYKYVYSTKYRSNSIGLLLTYLYEGYDIQGNEGYGKCYEQNLAYAEKHGMVLPYTYGWQNPSSSSIAYNDIYAAYEAWIKNRNEIPVTVASLNTYVVGNSGVITENGDVVTIPPGTRLELPQFGILQFHLEGVRKKLIIGASGATAPVVIGTVDGSSGWTGFGFWPGDRYGRGPDGILEILSPFEFENMKRPYRFYQLTRNAQVLE